MTRFSPCLAGACLLLAAAPPASAQGNTYAHFEARHTHPAGLSPDGTRLFVLNSPDARLSVFDVSNPANAIPILIAEIPVGLEPVSLKARTSDEVWVVNEVSDSVSVVSLAAGTVIATLQVPDEPADVVFANGRAFVSCARNNTLRVFDAATRAELAPVPLEGLYPRALAASPNGSKIYAAFQLSGNATTILPHTAAPPQPPGHPSLPPPPQTALIVPAADTRINYTVIDHDVAEIDTASLNVVRYLSGTGTNLFDLAISPATGHLWIANTEARNLVRFEPALRGHFIDNRLSRVALPAQTVTAFDLNPGIDYTVLPNPEAQDTALSQPAALVFASDGAFAWVAAFGSDRIAKVTADGAVAARIDLRPPHEDSSRMRGPRGLAWNETTRRLYVMNKLTNSVTVIDSATGAILTEVPAGSYDPMPPAVKAGRGFLFDARLSGNGTASCAACHLDADRDGLAWDLGDPEGLMVTVTGQNLSVHDTTPRDRVMHPMKGPMVTQTLRGIGTAAPFHWRGDRPAIQSFAITFDKLMGGMPPGELDMSMMTEYIASLRNHPNPNRNLDRSLPATFAGGNPSSGRTLYNNHLRSHCAICHVLPTGSDNNIDLSTEVGSTQPVKNTPLGTVYQRTFFNPRAGQRSLSGFGLLHDGTGFALPTVHPYVLSELETPQEFADVAAFVLCFDTGTAPATGFSRTVTPGNRAAAALLADLETLEGQAAAAACDLVARGLVQGRQRAFYYDAAALHYRAGAATLSRQELLAALQTGDALTFMGTWQGDGARMGGDRDANGTADADEPAPELTLESAGGTPLLRWPQNIPDWFPETNGGSAWTPLTQPRTTGGGFHLVPLTPPRPERSFFRLRRTW